MTGCISLAIAASKVMSLALFEVVRLAGLPVCSVLLGSGEVGDDCVWISVAAPFNIVKEKTSNATGSI